MVKIDRKVREVISHIKLAEAAVGSNEITSDKVTTLGVAFPFPAPPFDLTIPWNVVVAIVLSS